MKQRALWVAALGGGGLLLAGLLLSRQNAEPPGPAGSAQTALRWADPERASNGDSRGAAAEPGSAGSDDQDRPLVLTPHIPLAAPQAPAQAPRFDRTKAEQRPGVLGGMARALHADPRLGSFADGVIELRLKPADEARVLNELMHLRSVNQAPPGATAPARDEGNLWAERTQLANELLPKLAPYLSGRDLARVLAAGQRAPQQDPREMAMAAQGHAAAGEGAPNGPYRLHLLTAPTNGPTP